ncbi:ACR3 family arsenite efflux transporter [Citrobacter amalonaticus]|uniref:ACR3 family arsenite efflux transporter n=1 Tax=Citrobacter amalonaticus TaxID=35703 RepID=UPI00339C7C45
MSESKKAGIGFIEKYLSVWVLISMVLGILISQYLPEIPEALGKMQIAEISIPIAVLIWVMVYPMMLKVDFASVKDVGKSPKGLILTWVVNWLIKPFTMYGIVALFLHTVFSAIIPADLASEYLAGAALLGAAPCTAMVFVWSELTKGNPAYTLVQVASNDLILLVAFVPTVAFLLGTGGIEVPWDTLILSVSLFVVVPLIAGVATRMIVSKAKGKDYFENSFVPKFNKFIFIGLLIMLVIIFIFQGKTLLSNPLHIALLAIPMILQSFLNFFLAYLGARALKLPHDVASPAALIGASNFFEFAVAVAIALFGPSSPVVLAVTVGVLVEVPLMLAMVKIANRTTHWFERGKSGQCSS